LHFVTVKKKQSKIFHYKKYSKNQALNIVVKKRHWNKQGTFNKHSQNKIIMTMIKISNHTPIKVKKENVEFAIATLHRNPNLQKMLTRLEKKLGSHIYIERL